MQTCPWPPLWLRNIVLNSKSSKPWNLDSICYTDGDVSSHQFSSKQSPCQWKYCTYISNNEILFTQKDTLPILRTNHASFHTSNCIYSFCYFRIQQSLLSNHTEMNEEEKDSDKYILLLINVLPMTIFKDISSTHHQQKWLTPQTQSF